MAKKSKQILSDMKLKLKEISWKFNKLKQKRSAITDSSDAEKLLEKNNI